MFTLLWTNAQICMFPQMLAKSLLETGSGWLVGWPEGGQVGQRQQVIIIQFEAGSQSQRICQISHLIRRVAWQRVCMENCRSQKAPHGAPPPAESNCDSESLGAATGPTAAAAARLLLGCCFDSGSERGALIGLMKWTKCEMSYAHARTRHSSRKSVCVCVCVSV